MLEVRCPKYLEEVRRFATDNGILDRLEQQLDRLSGFLDGKAVCVLSQDFAPYSFQFNVSRPVEAGGIDRYGKYLLNGGLIFYTGSESGVGMPQLSVTNSGRKDSRWEINT